MNAFTLLFINLSCLGCLTFAEKDTESGKTPPKEEWLDPGNMISYDAEKTFHNTGPNVANKQTDCGTLQVKLSQCYKDLEKLPQYQSCSEKTVVNTSSCDTPYFKKVARILLGNIEDRGDHEVTVPASEDDAATLEKFVSSDEGNVQDVCEVIVAVLLNFKGRDGLYEFGQWDTSSFGLITKETLLILAALLFVICAVGIYERRTNLTWQEQLRFVVAVCFIISIPWEWYHLYRKAFASKHAQMEKEIPKQCKPEHELTPLDSLKLWLRNAFTFSDDPCVKYQETLLVDPMWEVSPSKAISATLASAISHPFEVLAEATGKAFRALFREVPIQWQPVMFIAIVVIIIIFLFMLSGLEVKLPFMTIRTVPTLPGNLPANLQLLQNQVQNIEAVVQQLNNAAVEREGIERIPLEDEIRHQQRQIMELLNAIHQAGRQQEQRAIGVVGGGADNGGAEEERPERAPVPESPKLKVPVQSSDQGIKFMFEQLGPCEDS